MDYDTSVEHYPCHPNTTNQPSHKQNTILAQLISSTLDGLSKWDAVYFLDIARNGYQYEQNMAFFPLFPLSVHTFGLILTPLKLLLNLSDRSRLLLSAMFVNTVAFTIAAVGLYKLTQTIFHSSKLAQRVVVLFCFNPASVFFSAAYSESIFAMTQFWGMLFLERDRHLISALIFALGTTARSNGLISCGFIGYKCLQEIIPLYRLFMLKGERIRPKTVVLKSLKVACLLFIIILPFLLFQYYSYRLFCKNPQLSPWCDHYLPIPYSYIQKHYWNVGFLKYYELKQLPNFVLASPVVFLSIVGVYEYLARQTKKDILSLGLWVVKKTNSLNIFVYVVHLGFLLAFGIASMHVQVKWYILFTAVAMQSTLMRETMFPGLSTFGKQ